MYGVLQVQKKLYGTAVDDWISQKPKPPAASQGGSVKEMGVPATTPLKRGCGRSAEFWVNNTTTPAQQHDRGLLHGFVSKLGSRNQGTIPFLRLRDH